MRWACVIMHGLVSPAHSKQKPERRRWGERWGGGGGGVGGWGEKEHIITAGGSLQKMIDHKMAVYPYHNSVRFAA